MLTSFMLLLFSLSLSLSLSICERVTPRLSHANAAVVLSAVKVGVVMLMMSFDVIICI